MPLTLAIQLQTPIYLDTHCFGNCCKPIRDMHQLFTNLALLLDKRPSHKPYPPHTTFPQSVFEATQWPVISPCINFPTIVCGNTNRLRDSPIFGNTERLTCSHVFSFRSILQNIIYLTKLLILHNCFFMLKCTKFLNSFFFIMHS